MPSSLARQFSVNKTFKRPTNQNKINIKSNKYIVFQFFVGKKTIKCLNLLAGHRDREGARRHPGAHHLDAGPAEVEVRVLDGR